MKKLHIRTVLAVASILSLSVFVNGISANKKFSNKEDENITELHVGIKYKPASCDVQARNGDRIQVHYDGMLTDGTVFDSSYDRLKAVRFRLGRGRVIRGLDKGILGMCLGEKRRIKVPPQLGYGDKGHPPEIPGGASLVFDIELVAVNDKTILDLDN